MRVSLKILLFVLLVLLTGGIIALSQWKIPAPSTEVTKPLSIDNPFCKNEVKYLSQFLESLSAERGYALNTLQAYARDIKDFNVFLEEKRLEDIKKTDVKRYLVFLQEHAIASSSRARKISALRQFF
jgi:CHASE3 domain sensor protein